MFFRPLRSITRSVSFINGGHASLSALRDQARWNIPSAHHRLQMMAGLQSIEEYGLAHHDALSPNYYLGGYAPIKPGDRVGPGYKKRFEVIRKVGWGESSTMWIVRDIEQDHFFAMKAYTTNDTEDIIDRSADVFQRSQELTVLRRISEPSAARGARHCLPLINHFILHSEGAQYLCTLLPVTGVDTFKMMQLIGTNGGLPENIVRRLAHQLCMALDYLHSDCRVVHAGVAAENILLTFDDAMTDELIRIPLSHQHRPPEMNGVGVNASPLPLPGETDLPPSDYTIKLGGFGNARWLNKPQTRPTESCAPEEILGISWNEKIDIWSLGCVVFEWLAGTPLFDWTREPFYDTSDMLAQQLEVWQTDRMPLGVVVSARDGSEYLNDDGTLKELPNGGLRPANIRSRIEQRQVAVMTDSPRSQLALATSFIERCLVLDPNERPSAAELLRHPWLLAADDAKQTSLTV